MGRESKRVPIDFDWPQGKVWQGFLLPDRLDEARCGTCAGTGYTADALWLSGIAYILAELAGDPTRAERGHALHPWVDNLRQNVSYCHGAGRPTPAFGEFLVGLVGEENGGADRIFGPDVHRVALGLRKAAGLPDKWGWCPECEGHGSTEVYEGQRAEAEAWESTEPPSGDGWQMWETTSEGSPMSPVFATAEELARWLTDTGASTFGYNTASYETWLRIITGQDIAMVQIAPGVVIL